MKPHTKQDLLTSRRNKSQHVAMGANAAGLHPYHGERSDVTLPGPLHHSHSRKFEVDASAGKGLAREGTTHKQSQIAVHAGANKDMRALSGSFDPTTPVPQGKRTSPVVAHPSMRSRNDDTLSSEAPGTAHARAKSTPDVLHLWGKKVLDEALKGSSVDDRRALGDCK